MQTKIFEKCYLDANDNPAGGVAFGNGFTISWQRGPLGRVGTEERVEPNGAFVEDIIKAAAGRIAFYQASKFACQENADALAHLEQAIASLEGRTKRRTVDQTEGTHEGS